MADGAYSIKLDEYASAKLTAKAEALGISPEELVSTLLHRELFDLDDFTWINGDPRASSLKPADLEGARDWDEVRPEFMALVEKTFGPE